MTNDSEMLDMQAFLVGTLSRTGEYEFIEVGGEIPNSSALNMQKKRNIVARKKPELGQEEPTLDYLVVASADLMPTDLFHRKTREAKERKIALMHVLYKGGDSPFFEWDRAIFKPSRNRYDKKTRRELINTKGMERDNVDLTGNMAVYFDAKTHTLKIISFDEVIAEYHHKHYVLQKERELVRSKRHQVTDEMNFFSLQPYIKDERILAKPYQIDEGNAKTIESFLEIESRLRRSSDPDTRARICERISLMLDSMTDAQLRFLTKRYGAARLGAYATQSGIDAIKHQEQLQLNL